MAKIRNRGEVMGFGVPAALFLPGVAYIGSTNGHQFITNDFFAFTYCLASVGFASVPLLAWRRGGGQYAETRASSAPRGSRGCSPPCRTSPTAPHAVTRTSSC
ncbi:MAG TPA: hypothetical protein VIS09_02410 [Streptomyces sp.]